MISVPSQNMHDSIHRDSIPYPQKANHGWFGALLNLYSCIKHTGERNTLVIARNKASFFLLIYPSLPYVPKQRRKVLITGVTGVLPCLQSRAFSEKELVLSLFPLTARAHKWVVKCSLAHWGQENSLSCTEWKRAVWSLFRVFLGFFSFDLTCQFANG